MAALVAVVLVVVVYQGQAAHVSPSDRSSGSHVDLFMRAEPISRPARPGVTGCGRVQPAVSAMSAMSVMIFPSSKSFGV